MVAYLREAYQHERTKVIARQIKERFGCEVSAQAVYDKAYRLGIGRLPRALPERSVKRICWKCEPIKNAWMDEHDHGQSLTTLSAEFAQAFGFPLSRSQISLWRSSHGRQSCPGRAGGGRKRRPVGAERESDKGYTLVKVAREASVPQSKDNWRMKHVLVWEKANGQELPEGMDVVFADRDCKNFDPENLVAVPHALMALLNSDNTPDWNDAESLKAAVAIAELKRGIVQAEKEMPRVCPVCGKTFTNVENDSVLRNRKTCPDCRAQGKKARGVRTVKAIKKCVVCGNDFEAGMKNQVRCRACIDAAPKLDAKVQKRRMQ